jgi:hypothetical protein
LTGWDIDNLTPPEFQNGVQRLDQTLKALGIGQEMVDKVVALGLIDVRDIEEVGTGPLMEELGLDEEKAQTVVDRCAEEAKIVAKEQEGKKAAEAAAKAADRKALALSAAAVKGIDGQAFANPLLPQTPHGTTPAGDEVALTDELRDTDNGNRMPGAMESAAGGSPEVMVHRQDVLSSSSDLSPEERAVQGIETNDAANQGRKDYADEDADTSALAEGRVAPPAQSGNG